MSNKQFNCFPWLKPPLSHIKILCLIQVGFDANESLQKCSIKINSINDTQILLFFCGFLVVTSHWLADIFTSLIFLFLCLVRVGFGANESLQKYYFFGFLVENLNKRTVFRLHKDFANVETKFMQYLVVGEFLRDQKDEWHSLFLLDWYMNWFNPWKQAG